MRCCQSCPDLVHLIPRDGEAACPVCDYAEPGIAVQPLFVVTGASGTGKTTVVPLVTRLLRGECVVFDVDWLIDPARTLSRGQEVMWSAVREIWVTVAHGIAQSGMTTLLFGPIGPGDLDELTARRWVGDVHYLLLDCSDDARAARIESRPAYRAHDVEDQKAYAASLRPRIENVLNTDTATPTETAAAIASWVRSHWESAIRGG